MLSYRLPIIPSPHTLLSYLLPIIPSPHTLLSDLSLSYLLPTLCYRTFPYRTYSPRFVIVPSPIIPSPHTLLSYLSLSYLLPTLCYRTFPYRTYSPRFVIVPSPIIPSPHTLLSYLSLSYLLPTLCYRTFPYRTYSPHFVMVPSPYRTYSPHFVIVPSPRLPAGVPDIGQLAVHDAVPGSLRDGPELLDRHHAHRVLAHPHEHQSVLLHIRLWVFFWWFFSLVTLHTQSFVLFFAL